MACHSVQILVFLECQFFVAAEAEEQCVEPLRVGNNNKIDGEVRWGKKKT